MRVKRALASLIGATLFALGTTTALTGCAVTPEGVAYIQVAPPPPPVEVVGVAPAPGFVWIEGHHTWEGRAYVWVPGRWEQPPSAHARWQRGRWRHNAHGWFWVEGRWS